MLARGTRLGSYEVVGTLGAGGMGEVFRARDLRLGREVAVKVLSERFRLDSQRLVRFEREARVLASLNHPNIAMLHSVEPLGDTQALVLELVEGETLADRISRGPLPLPEALATAKQIAAALEAAHERGVIHRDLKPSNIRLRTDGTVKLLDFGLAKVSEAASAGAGAHAPTVTMETGYGEKIMGTPAYMSPEHARGLAVDKRTDIWSFGCVLYEMLTGKPPFPGTHATDVIAKILEREPDFEALPPEVPPGLRLLLFRCLRKDPRERLRDMGDARLDFGPSGATDAGGGLDAIGITADRSGPQSRRNGRRGWSRAAIVASVLALLGIAFDVGWHFVSKPVPSGRALSVSRFSIAVPSITTTFGRSLAISADGSTFAYISDRGLVVRSRDRLELTEIPARSGSYIDAPFFSPDGQWLAYTDSQRFMKVPVDGGPAVEITDSGPAAMGDWSTAGIVFTNVSGLFHLPIDGKVARRLDAGLAANEQAMFPQFLPGNRAVLFTVISTRTNTPNAVVTPGSRVDVLDLETGNRHTVLRGAGRARYVPTGHLTYVTDQKLYAVPFDAARFELGGSAVQMLTGVSTTEYGIADEGTLVYLSGGGSPNSTLVWVDREGREEPIEAPPRHYIYPRISPDGSRVALDMQGPHDRDIWFWDLHRRTLERFTVDPSGNPLVAWTRDGRSLAFGSDRYGVTNLFMQPADGSGEAQRLLVSDRVQMPLSFAPDGRLLFSADVAGHGRDIMALSMDGSRRVEPVLQTVANDLTCEVSPDGRWIVYDSDETGQFEVYVRPYPQVDAGGRWQISAEGGRQPMWSRDGREIYYRDFDGAMWAVPVTGTSPFAPGPGAKLFANPDYAGRGRLMTARTYDVSADGRFLMIKTPGTPESAASTLIVVLNWFEELRRMAPAAHGG